MDGGYRTGRGSISPALPPRQHGYELVQLWAGTVLRRQAPDRLRQKYRHTESATAFALYQAYDADKAGIWKFINELFVKGTFTENRPLNPKVGLAGEEIYDAAKA
jgi:hypothetical protein